MPKIHDLEYQAAIRDFLTTRAWDHPVEVTLTMKQALPNPFRRLTPDAAQQNFRHFLNLLNADVHGKAFKRHGRRCKVIPVQEGGDIKGLHNHALIDRPGHVSSEDFTTAIKSAWSKTDWAYGHTWIVPSTNAISDGFLGYITKLDDKLVYADSIDWNNTFLG